MEASLLFESFMVFYLLEVGVLISVFMWYYREAEMVETNTTVKSEQQGPTASQMIKMRQLAAQMEREQK